MPLQSATKLPKQLLIFNCSKMYQVLNDLRMVNFAVNFGMDSKKLKKVDLVKMTEVEEKEGEKILGGHSNKEDQLT